MTEHIVAYELDIDLQHLQDLPDPSEREYGEIEDFDITIYEPTKPDEIDRDFSEQIVPYCGVEPINFLGFLDRLPHKTDYPNNEFLWPIMSKRMLYTLNSLRDFPHKAIPLNIFDHKQEHELEHYLRRGIRTLGTCNQDYILLQLLERIDAIDFDHTEYEQPIPNSILLPRINRLVLREPFDGFPPIFRLAREYTEYLYVSKAAKQVLEASGIKGIRFIPKVGVKANTVDSV
jgi:hypothetical protein